MHGVVGFNSSIGRMRRSSSSDSYAGLAGGQGAGIATFVSAVVGYTLVHRLLSSPWSPGGRSSSRPLRALDPPTTQRPALAPPPTATAAAAAGGGAAAAGGATPLPYKVGLLDLTVPSRRSPSYTNLLLANDMCIERAVQSVSETLYVYLQEDPGLPSSSTVASAPSSSAASSTASQPSPTAPELRVYLSELYGQLWDVCYLHRNLQLDVRIIYNTTAGTLPPTGGKGQKKKGAGTAAAASGPITREEALLKPDLEAVFSRRSPETELANARRGALGLNPLKLEWLDEHVKVALETPFFYLEDDQTHIPHFPKVAVGGTFDRLHNGHKKLLSLAACVCQGELTIGITSTEMLAKKKNADQIEPLEDRKENVRAFLASVFPDLKVAIVVLKDPFGPPAHEADFDAIVVSSETIAGAVKINELRAAKGFKPLTVVVTRRTVSSLLSSTFIRNNLPPRRRSP